jgi:peptidoglycan DL-endopeptidase CwlO
MSRYRYPYRRYRRRWTPGEKKAAAVLAVVVAAAAGSHSAAAARTGSGGNSGTPSHAAAVAIAYARAQLGKPYCWGGTGPSCFDCSGLVMEAWAAAGVSIPRTTFAQWAALPHVSSPAPGDPVFAPGGDGTWSQPGHVGMYLGNGRVIEAYATGYSIFVTSLGNFGATSGGIVGYAEVG